MKDRSVRRCVVNGSLSGAGVLSLVFFALALSAAFAVRCVCQQAEASAADPCAGAKSTYASSECWRKQYEAADAELNRVYQEIMARLPDAEKAKLRESQRAWIPKKEKKGDEAAANAPWHVHAPIMKTIALTEETQARTAELKKSYGYLLSSEGAGSAKLEGTGGGTAPSPAKASGQEPAVTGSWIQVKGPADFDSMDLALEGGDRVFRSYLHERPAWFGHWQLSGDQLTAQNDDGEKIAWTVVSASSDKLVLREEGEKEVTVFKKAKQRRPPND